jgi:hypothetical protein
MFRPRLLLNPLRLLPRLQLHLLPPLLLVVLRARPRISSL